jgi:hypothetical protein
MQSDVPYINPKRLAVATSDRGELRIEYDGETHERAQAVALFPLSAPTECIELISASETDTRAIGLIASLDALTSEQRGPIERDLRLRSFVPAILDIISIRTARHAETWEVRTDRGPATFTVRGRRENMRFAGSGAITITDDQGRRFRIATTDNMSRRARRELAKIL